MAVCFGYWKVSYKYEKGKDKMEVSECRGVCVHVCVQI